MTRPWWRPGRRAGPLYRTLFERAGGFALEAADALVALFAENEITPAAFAALDEIEHRADANTHDLLARLEKGHVPPVPAAAAREIALALDGIVDAAEGAGELAVLTGARRATPLAQEMATVLARAAREIASLTSYIGGGTGYRPYVARIHDHENEGDDLWMAAFGSLFAGGLEPLEVIRWKEIYAQLEEAIDGCEHTAKLIERALGRG